MFVLARDIEKRLGWKSGRAERLAKQRRLPHYILPDGQLRFLWDDIEPLIVRVPEVAVVRAEVPADAD